MSDLFANPLEEMIEIPGSQDGFTARTGTASCHGMPGFAEGASAVRALADLTPWKLIVTYDDSRAREICEDYRCFDTDISLYPARDLLFYTSDIHGNLLTKQRIQVMRRVLESSGGVVVTTIDGLMEHLLPLAWMKERSLTIGAEDVVEVGKLTHALAEMGYEKVAQVEGSGQFSVRGGIIDIFPLTEESAVPDRAVGRRGRFDPYLRPGKPALDRAGGRGSDLSGDGDGADAGADSGWQSRRSRKNAGNT